LLVGFAFVTVMLSATLPTPLYPLYQQKHGFSSFTMTVVFAIYAAGVIVALLFLGGLSDLVGRRPVLFAGLGFAALSAVVFLLSEELWALLTARLLSGISAGIFTGTATAALVDLAPESQRHRAGLAAAALNMLGLGLGPVTAGVLATYGSAPLVAPFVTSLILVLLASVGLRFSAEPRPAVGGFVVRVERPRVPAEVRVVFVRAALAAFAGFSVMGLFTAVSPTLLGILGVHDHAVVGLVVFSFFGASAVGQLATARSSEYAALRGGVLVMGVGGALVGVGLLTAALPLFLAGAVVSGSGQGASFRAGLIALTRMSAAGRRAEVTSSFFVVCYVALAVPVVGVGALTAVLGSVSSGVVCSVVVVALAIVSVILQPRVPGARIES
jgi:MFS family permease